MGGSETEFDYVVVGAGSSGCVLANRLSADGSTRVAVIEAGPRDSSFWIHLPIGYGRTMWDPVVNWKFQTEPEPNMGGRQIYWPRGACSADQARSTASSSSADSPRTTTAGRETAPAAGRGTTSNPISSR